MLREIEKRENDYVLSKHRHSGSKGIRLERALKKAYEWQNTLVPDFESEVHGRTYVGPLKWVVCLLGNDVYTVNQFHLNEKAKLKQQENFSISMLALSTEPLVEHARQYSKLCHLSQEGIYCNIVHKSVNWDQNERHRVEALAQRFFSAMQVYPSEKKLVIREYFSSL